MLRSTLFTLASLSLVAQTPKPETKPSPKPAVAATPAPSATKAEDKIIAKVGSELIRVSDIELGLQAANPQQRQQMESKPEAREQYIKSFAEFRLLVAKGKKENLQNSESFKKKLAFAVDQIIASELMARDADALKKKLEMSDADIQAYYDAHKDKFQTPGDLYSARHILVKVKTSDQDKEGNTDAEAKAKIAKIQAELKGGKKLADLAKEYSDDPGSKNNGGLYENFPAEQMVAEFGNAVKSQAIGVVGEPVKTQFGYHLIEVTAKTPKGTVKPLETVKPDIQKVIGPERQEQVWKEYLDGIKKEIPYEFYGESKASAVKTDTPAAAAPKAAAEPKSTDANAKKAAPAAKKPTTTPATKKNS